MEIEKERGSLRCTGLPDLKTMWMSYAHEIEWTREQCNQHVLRVVEENLTTCGLTPEWQRTSLTKGSTVNPNLRNSHGETLMHAVIKYLERPAEHVKIKEHYLWALIKNGADPNLIETGGRTSLMYSAIYNRVKAAKILANLPNSNLLAQDPDGNSALHLAAENHHPDVVRQLIRAAVKKEKFTFFTIRNNENQTAEDIAISSNQKTIAKILNHERIKCLKTVTKKLSESCARYHRRNAPQQWFPDIVFGVLALHRWRRYARQRNRAEPLAKQRSNSSINMADFQHTNLGLNENESSQTPTTSRGRSHSVHWFMRRMSRPQVPDDIDDSDGGGGSNTEPSTDRLKTLLNALSFLHVGANRTLSEPGTACRSHIPEDNSPDKEQLIKTEI